MSVQQLIVAGSQIRNRCSVCIERVPVLQRRDRFGRFAKGRVLEKQAFKHWIWDPVDACWLRVSLLPVFWER